MPVDFACCCSEQNDGHDVTEPKVVLPMGSITGPTNEDIGLQEELVKLQYSSNVDNSLFPTSGNVLAINGVLKEPFLSGQDQTTYQVEQNDVSNSHASLLHKEHHVGKETVSRESVELSAVRSLREGVGRESVELRAASERASIGSSSTSSNKNIKENKFFDRGVTATGLSHSSTTARNVPARSFAPFSTIQLKLEKLDDVVIMAESNITEPTRGSAFEARPTSRTVGGSCSKVGTVRTTGGAYSSLLSKNKSVGRESSGKNVCSDSASLTVLHKSVNPHGLRTGNTCEFTQASSIEESFSVVKALGQGGFGTVSEVVCLAGSYDGMTLAMKAIPKANILNSIQFERELGISRKLNHPNIVMLYEYFIDTENIFLIMECCQGGDLIDYLNRHWGVIAPPLSIRFFWQMLSGLAYIHHYKVAHRDVKPENYMLQVPDGSELKLIDFGLSRSFKSGMMKSKVGTLVYAAPEILLDQPYDDKVDIWSVGVTSLTVCQGSQPFLSKGCTDAEKAARIKKGEINWHRQDIGAHQPPELVKLVQSLLKVNPTERPPAKELAHDRWLLSHRRESNPCCSLQ